MYSMCLTVMNDRVDGYLEQPRPFLSMLLQLLQTGTTKTRGRDRFSIHRGVHETAKGHPDVFVTGDCRAKSEIS